MRPPLEPFGDDLWLADGADVTVLGFRYPTRMAVLRLGGSGLLLWSPVALTPPLREAIASLGAVRHLVAPNHLHHLFLADWAAGFPEARLHAPAALRRKRPDLTVHADLAETPDPAWADALDQVRVPGNRITTETVFFHRKSGTVLFCDLLQQFPEGWHRGWRALVARLDLMVAPEPSVPRKFRLAFTDRPAARAALVRIRAWPARAVVMAHGTPVTEDAPEAIDRAFRWLTG